MGGGQTGSGLCLMAGFHNSGVNLVLLTPTSLIKKINHTDKGYEDWKYVELVQDHVQWEAPVLVVLHLQNL